MFIANSEGQTEEQSASETARIKRNQAIAQKLDQIEDYNVRIDALRQANDGYLLNWRYSQSIFWPQSPLTGDRLLIVQLTSERNEIADELAEILKT